MEIEALVDQKDKNWEGIRSAGVAEYEEDVRAAWLQCGSKRTAEDMSTVGRVIDRRG